jgi:hypothetical protein
MASLDFQSASTEELERFIGNLLGEHSMGLKPTTDEGAKEVGRSWMLSFLERNRSAICGNAIIQRLCNTGHGRESSELITQLADLIATLLVPHYLPCAAVAYLTARYGISNLCSEHWNNAKV